MKIAIEDARIEECPAHCRLDLFIGNFDKFLGIDYTDPIVEKMKLRPGDKLKVVLIKGGRK